MPRARGFASGSILCSVRIPRRSPTNFAAGVAAAHESRCGNAASDRMGRSGGLAAIELRSPVSMRDDGLPTLPQGQEREADNAFIRDAAGVGRRRSLGSGAISRRPSGPANVPHFHLESPRATSGGVASPPFARGRVIPPAGVQEVRGIEVRIDGKPAARASARGHRPELRCFPVSRGRSGADSAWRSSLIIGVGRERRNWPWSRTAEAIPIS